MAAFEGAAQDNAITEDGKNRSMYLQSLYVLN